MVPEGKSPGSFLSAQPSTQHVSLVLDVYFLGNLAGHLIGCPTMSREFSKHVLLYGAVGVTGSKLMDSVSPDPAPTG